MRRHTDELRAAAIDDYATGLSAKEVSKKHRLSEGTVLVWVRDAGITRPRGGGSNRLTTEKRAAALADLTDSGDPLAHVAARHGISPNVLAQWRDAEAEHAFTGTWIRDGLVWRPALAAEVIDTRRTA